MIQRIQSVFLLLASACFFLLFVIPFASTKDAVSPFFEDRIFDPQDSILILILAILGGVLTLLSLFLFKNRPGQMKMAYVGMVISILLPLVAIFIFSTQSEALPDQIEISEGIGIALPISSLVFLLLAIRFIRKDEKLVRSMDRLR